MNWKLEMLAGLTVAAVIAGMTSGGGSGGGLPAVQPVREVNFGDLAGRLETSLPEPGTAIADSAEAPLFVFLHGRDAGRDQLLPLVGAFPPGARRLFLDGPLGAGANRRWYDPPSSSPPSVLAEAIKQAAAQVAAAIAEATLTFPTSRVVVVGYSQGASIGYELTAEGRTDILLAIAGFFPPPLYPNLPANVFPPSIFAVHGQADANVSISRGRAAFDAFQNPPERFITVPAAGHALANLVPATIQLIKEVG